MGGGKGWGKGSPLCGEKLSDAAAEPGEGGDWGRTLLS